MGLKGLKSSYGWIVMKGLKSSSWTDSVEMVKEQLGID